MTEKEKVIQIYRDVLKGKRYRFPDHFFIGEQGKKNLANITRYLIEEYLEIPVEEIPLQVKAKTLWNHRLKAPAQGYGWKYIDVIENAYPQKFHPLEFEQVSNGYWKGNEGSKRAIEAVRYVIKKKCKIPHEEIPLKINHRFFKENRLGGVFSLFGDSPYKVINAAYPGFFKPWEFSHVPMNYWKHPENVKQTMDWFLFQKIGFSSYADANLQLTQKHFFQYKLTGFFQIAFDQRLFKVKQWIQEQMNACYSKTPPSKFIKLN